MNTDLYRDRSVGTVKWYHRKKGFGFISANAGEDIFFHSSNLSRTLKDKINDGDSVTFRLRKGSKGIFAADILPTDENMVDAVSDAAEEPEGDFPSLGLNDDLLRAIEKAGYSSPTPIQQAAIRHGLDGKDILGCAQTGTGKTAAFALPTIQCLSETSGRKRAIRALVLAPTRELAIQIEEGFRTYGHFSGLKSLAVFGGVGQNPQVNAIRKGVDVLVATPGRLLDLTRQGHIKLDTVQVLILDEADRMLDMGFLPDIRAVIKLVPDQRQTMLFSATMPTEIRKLASSLLTDPVEISISPEQPTVEAIEQSVYFVSKKRKQELLEHLLADPDRSRVLVFTRTKHGANRVVRDLKRSAISAEPIHGNMSQSARQKSLRNFREGNTRVLVATDVAARGIDVDDISHVIQFDLPNEPETYVHRIGRTGRAGAEGIAMAFCAHNERSYLASIERLTGEKVAPVREHPFAG